MKRDIEQQQWSLPLTQIALAAILIAAPSFVVGLWNALGGAVTFFVLGFLMVRRQPWKITGLENHLEVAYPFDKRKVQYSVMQSIGIQYASPVAGSCLVVFMSDEKKKIIVLIRVDR